MLPLFVLASFVLPSVLSCLSTTLIIKYHYDVAGCNCHACHYHFQYHGSFSSYPGLSAVSSLSSPVALSPRCIRITMSSITSLVRRTDIIVMIVCYIIGAKCILRQKRSIMIYRCTHALVVPSCPKLSLPPGNMSSGVVKGW